MSLSCICDEGAVSKKVGDGSMQKEVVQGALGSHSDVFLEVRLLPHSRYHINSRESKNVKVKKEIKQSKKYIKQLKY